MNGRRKSTKTSPKITLWSKFWWNWKERPSSMAHSTQSMGMNQFNLMLAWSTYQHFIKFYFLVYLCCWCKMVKDNLWDEYQLLDIGDKISFPKFQGSMTKKKILLRRLLPFAVFFRKILMSFMYFLWQSFFKFLRMLIYHSYIYKNVFIKNIFL